MSPTRRVQSRKRRHELQSPFSDGFRRLVAYSPRRSRRLYRYSRQCGVWTRLFSTPFWIPLRRRPDRDGRLEDHNWASEHCTPSFSGLEPPLGLEPLGPHEVGAYEDVYTLYVVYWSYHCFIQIQTGYSYGCRMNSHFILITRTQNHTLANTTCKLKWSNNQQAKSLQGRVINISMYNIHLLLYSLIINTLTQ